MASKLSTLINALTGKTTPVDADKIPILDSENSFNHNWLSFTQLKVYLATLFSTTDAATLGSGSATDNYVLTADGLGGAAWEAAAGGDLVDDTTPQLGGDLDLNGHQITGSGGTVTTSQPIIDVTQTWNDAAVTFTGIKANITDTASAEGSLLLDLQTGGSSAVKITKNLDQSEIRKPGAVYPVIRITAIDATVNQYTQFGSLNNLSTWEMCRIGYINTAHPVAVNLRSTTVLGWTSAGSNINPDTKLYRDAAATLAQRDTTNAQTYRIYNTWTDASNYERLAFTWDSNTAKIQTEAAGTGTLRDLSIGSTGGKLAFLGATPVVRQAHVVDADTAHALNATFSDTEVESALNALAGKINSILATLEAFGLHATS